MNKRILILFVMVFIMSVSCAKREKPAIVIGDIEITAHEFEDAFKNSRFSNAKEAGRGLFLDELIRKKLILREAERAGLHKNPEFLRDIQLFWEQGLLKIVFSQKTKELATSVNVTDDEVKDYYRKHKERDFPDKELSAVYDQLKWMLLRVKQNQAIVEWAESLRRRTNITVDYKSLGINE